MKTSLQFLQRLPFFLVLLTIGCRTSPPTKNAPSYATAVPTSSQSVPAIGTQSKAPTSSYTIPGSLTDLNKLFLDSYVQRQATVRTNISPLIVANFSNLELYWHGMAETNRCIPDIYHALKAVAHVPFGIFLGVQAFANEGSDSVPDSVLQTLKSYQAQIQVAVDSLSHSGFSETQLVRQRQILRASQDYVSKVVASAKAPRSELMDFARGVGPLLLENANEAAAAQLEMTHAAVMGWKRRIPADEWKRLVVVVRGPQMPRRMNVLTQYFAKALDEPSHNLGYPLESRRLIYAEFIPQGRDHLDLMATTFIDGDASEVFFGDRWRMSRDLLADGAERYLRKINFN